MIKEFTLEEKDAPKTEYCIAAEFDLEKEG